jgi:hypothetical protein
MDRSPTGLNQLGNDLRYLQEEEQHAGGNSMRNWTAVEVVLPRQEPVLAE